MAEKSSPGTRQTDGKNLVWFGEIERKFGYLLNSEKKTERQKRNEAIVLLLADKKGGGRSQYKRWKKGFISSFKSRKKLGSLLIVIRRFVCTLRLSTCLHEFVSNLRLLNDICSFKY
jgi:hypothetical protein